MKVHQRSSPAGTLYEKSQEQRTVIRDLMDRTVRMSSLCTEKQAKEDSEADRKSISQNMKIIKSSIK